MADPTYFTCTLGQAAALGLTDKEFRNIPSFIASRARTSPDKYAVAWALPPENHVEDAAWRDLKFTFRALHAITTKLALELRRQWGQYLEKSATVALICPSTPELLFMWLAFMRLGHAVLLIAPQCQPPAIVHLCEACDITLLVYDEQYYEQAQRSKELAESSNLNLHIEKVRPLEDDLLSDGNDDLVTNTCFPEPGELDIAYLHHTSGTSSGVPKPIPQTHRAGCGVLPCFPDGLRAATFTTTPLYHGGIADAFRAWTSGALIWLFPGKGAPITARNVVKCLQVAQTSVEHDKTPPVKYFSSVPYVLQAMEADSRGLEILQTMEIVGVGGAALPEEVGNRLVDSGVNLISRFGSAECGFLMSSHRVYSVDKDWQYLRKSDEVTSLAFEANDGGLSELIIQDGWPHMAKRNRADRSFATADLFTAHEAIPDAWRYHSRADSQLTLITGKKFDPSPLESAIATSALLEDVLIFGNGQPYPGALLFRAAESTDKSDEAILNELWPKIEHLNRDSQDHARLARNMLLPMMQLDPPLEKSSKGTILRGVAEERFKTVIEQAYSSADDTSIGFISDEDVLKELKRLIQSVVGAPVEPGDNVDLFAYGVDSVSGIRIRRQVGQLLAESTKELPLNIVEDCGTVERLAKFVVGQRHGNTTLASGDEDELALMEDLVVKYGNFEAFSTCSISQGHKTLGNDTTTGSRSVKETVVLTGVTGALGAHVLDIYLRRHDTEHIYCLVRGPDADNCTQRVVKTLKQRGIGPLDTSRVTILSSDLGDRQLGLNDADYLRLATDATLILHMAWSVNFRMRLRSFEKDNIAGVTNLIGLALQSSRSLSPRIGFCSSVASVICSQGQESIPEFISHDTRSASRLGYSRSKWVAERICELGNKQDRLAGRVVVFRVGQLAGDSVKGVWNAKEAWPLMLSTAKITGTLPDLQDERLDWLPVDVAALALTQAMSGVPLEQETPHCSGQGDKTDQRGGPKEDMHVMHVVHPGPNPKWSQLLSWLGHEMPLRSVSPREWVKDLEESTAMAAATGHPALKLLELWKSAYAVDAGRVHEKDHYHDDNYQHSPDHDYSRRDPQASSKQNGYHAYFAMEETKQMIPTLRRVMPVDREYILKLWRWIDANM